MGVDYQNPDENPVVDFESYFEIFNKFLERKPGQEIHFELGRALVASCGSLISRVLYVKNGLKKNFIILDAGMTEFMRPALYQAYHKIENISRNLEAESSSQFQISRLKSPNTMWLALSVRVQIALERKWNCR